MACWNGAGEANEGTEAGSNAASSLSGSGYFEIHVKGQLDRYWSEWLEGLEVSYLENGEMILSGYILDQAALLGILNKVHRLNLKLLSVSQGHRKS